MKSRLSIQERLKDLRTERKLKLEELSNLTGISKSALGSYEADDYKEINHGNLVILADFYGVSLDYLLCRTENREQVNTPLMELHLNDETVELLKSGKINNRLLCEIITHGKFERLMTDTEIYIDGHATARFRDMNEGLEEQRLALIQKHRYVDGDLYSETLLAAQLEEEDFFCHVTQDNQNALKFPGDHLTKIWKVILNMLGIDFDKLPPDEQKVLKKVLAKSPVIKNNPLNFRRRRK